MNKVIKRTTFIVGSVLFGFILLVKILKEIPFLEVIDSFKQATPFAIGSFLLVSVVMMLMNTWRWSIIVKGSHMNVPFWKLFQYKIVGYGISFITPAAKVGGEPLRAALLKRHGINFNKALSTIVLDKIIDLSTTAGLFVLAIFLSITTFAVPKNMLLLLICMCTLLVSIIGFFYYQLLRDQRFFIRLFKGLRLHKIKSLQHLEEKIIEFEDVIVQFYKTRRKDFFKSLGISVIVWALMFIEFKTALLIFGISAISFEGLFLIICVMGAAYLIPIPLALGVLEVGQMSIFTVIGLKAAAGVGLALVIRARDLMWTFIAIIILLFYGFDLIKAYKESVQKGGLDIPKLEKKASNKSTDSKAAKKKTAKKNIPKKLNKR